MIHAFLPSKHIRRTQPRYGLGKSGWVTIPLAVAMPFDVLAEWLDESYRAVAKKRRIAELDALST